MDKSTEELLEILKNNSVDTVLKDNDNELLKGALGDYLHELITRKNLSKARVIEKADIFNIYGYQIFSGVKYPSRDKLIALCFGMELNLEESQTLLKYAGYAKLYPRNKRDSVIISALNRRQSVRDCNETLYGLGLELL